MENLKPQSNYHQTHAQFTAIETLARHKPEAACPRPGSAAVHAILVMKPPSTATSNGHAGSALGFSNPNPQPHLITLSVFANDEWTTSGAAVAAMPTVG